MEGRAAVTTRRARDRQHKRIVGVGLVVSLALHAVLLAGLDFGVPETEATVGSAEPNADAPLEFVSMELVNIEEVEPVPEEPMIADDRPVMADPAPDQVADAPAGDPTPAGPAQGAPASMATGAPPPAAAPSAADLIASLDRQSSVALAMRPQFVAHRLSECVIEDRVALIGEFVGVRAQAIVLDPMVDVRIVDRAASHVVVQASEERQ